MKWVTTTIGQHCTVTSSKRFHLSERSNSGIPFYCSKEIIQKVNGEEVTECDYIKDEAYERIKKSFGVPQAGDLLLTTRGTYGIPYIYQDRDKFYFADGNLTWLKDFDDSLLSPFLYYWIRSHEGQKRIDAIAKGTAQKAVPISLIKEIPLSIPPIQYQQKVVDILSAYDNLIENNQKQIKLLEEAAQRLYKEWFVDLRFPGHETTPIVDGVPEGWSKFQLSELISYEIGGGWGEESPTAKHIKEAYVIRGTDLSGITYGDFLSIPYRFHAESNLLSRKLIDGDIVFEVSGGSRTEGVARCLLITSTMLDVWRNNVMCASFCKLIRPKNGYSYYLHDCFKYMRATGKTEEYDKRSASSIVNYRWKDFLSQEMLLNPSSEIIEQYSNYSRAIYSKLVDCSLQISSAKIARDRLLPKLMNGEIEV